MSSEPVLDQKLRVGLLKILDGSWDEEELEFISFLLREKSFKGYVEDQRENHYKINGKWILLNDNTNCVIAKWLLTNDIQRLVDSYSLFEGTHRKWLLPVIYNVCKEKDLVGFQRMAPFYSKELLAVIGNIVIQVGSLEMFEFLFKLHEKTFHGNYDKYCYIAMENRYFQYPEDSEKHCLRAKELKYADGKYGFVTGGCFIYENAEIFNFLSNQNIELLFNTLIRVSGEAFSNVFLKNIATSQLGAKYIKMMWFSAGSVNWEVGYLLHGYTVEQMEAEQNRLLVEKKLAEKKLEADKKLADEELEAEEARQRAEDERANELLKAEEIKKANEFKKLQSMSVDAQYLYLHDNKESIDLIGQAAYEKVLDAYLAGNFVTL